MAGTFQLASRAENPEQFEDMFLVVGRTADPILTEQPGCTSDGDFVLSLEGKAVARATLYPPCFEKGIGTATFGRFEAVDPEAGLALLTRLEDKARTDGIGKLIGPMDGNTWQRYRLALPTPRNVDRHWFAGEPRNPDFYIALFEEAGFKRICLYESRFITPEAELAIAGRDRIEARAAKRGIRIESMEADRWQELLKRVFPLSLEAFTNNAFYSPVDESTFMKLYAPLESRLDPDLVRLAVNDQGDVLSFVLAYPDFLGPVLGSENRVIIKTVATAPAARSLGLGSLLIRDVAETAFSKGYSSVIHALMQVSNVSVKMSDRQQSRLYREYALYGKNL